MGSDFTNLATLLAQETSLIKLLDGAIYSLLVIVATCTLWHLHRRSKTSECGMKKEDVDAHLLDMSLVDVEMLQYEDDITLAHCLITRLLYREQVVCQWHGTQEGSPTAGTSAKCQGVCSADLSDDKHVLTLHGADGQLKLSIRELVEGWLIGAGSPEPAWQTSEAGRRIRRADRSKSMAATLQRLQTEQAELPQEEHQIQREEATVPVSASAGIDISLVRLEINEYGDEVSSEQCILTRLIYGEDVVSQWHGLTGVRLSDDKMTVTLPDTDGTLELSVTDLVEGWMLGAGCPAPAKSSRRRRTAQADGKSLRATLQALLPQEAIDKTVIIREQPSEPEKTTEFLKITEPVAETNEVFRVASPSRRGSKSRVSLTTSLRAASD